MNLRCIKKWNWLIVDLFKNEYKFCCKTPYNKITTTEIEKIINSDYIRATRLELLNDIKTADCSGCWQVEDMGLISERQHHSKYNNIQSKLNKDTDSFIQEIDFVLPNLCNAKCVYCNESVSSQWHIEKYKFKELKQVWKAPIFNEELDKNFWNWVNETGKHTINRFQFSGGETLLSQELYYFLDRIHNITFDSNITVEILTNGSVDPKYIEQLNKNWNFRLHIGISCESIGKRNEFIRYGTDWNLMDENINYMLKQDMNISFMSAINSLAISDYYNFLNYINNLKETHNKKIDLNYGLVTGPIIYNPLVTKDFFIHNIRKTIKILTKFECSSDIKTTFRKILNQESHITNLNDLYVDVQKLSNRRNFDFYDAFPEFESVFRTLNK